MDISHRTWVATIKLAIVVSVVAVAMAVAVTRVGDVPQAAIVIPVMVVAFTASWIQTERIQRREAHRPIMLPTRPTTKVA